MRVLITTDTVGGVWTFTYELCMGLLAAGCSVCLASVGRPPMQEHQQQLRQLRRAGAGRFAFHSCVAPLEWEDANYESYTLGVPLLRDLVESWRPNVLHLNQFCYGALDLPVPRLITIHSDVHSWAAACSPAAAPLSDPLPAAWLARYTRLVQEGIAGAHLLAAPTAWMRDAFLRHHPAQAPTVVIPNGLDLTPGSSTAPRTHRIVTAGRFWDAGKGMRLLTELPRQWRITVAGECPAAATAPHLTFTGQLSTAALHRLFRQSSLYLCTSLYEPFGLAPLEAALSGCAVFARDLPSLREVWGQAARFFASAEQLADLLQQHCNTPHALAAAQHQACARARLYTRERMTQGYLQAYTQTRRAAHA